MKLKTNYPMVDSVDLADYILAKKSPMNHLKLQKLLYYCEAWHLAIIGWSLISDDFQAWLHGPVCRKVWDHYKKSSVLFDNIPISQTQKRNATNKIKKSIAEEQIELINDVLKEYGKRSSYYLECLTHEEKPWREARKGYSVNSSCKAKISKKTMKEYYKSII